MSQYNKDLMARYGTKVLEFIESNIDLLDNNQFKELFNEALTHDPLIIGNLIMLLDDNNIDWIRHVDFIPPGAYQWSIRTGPFIIPNHIKTLGAASFAFCEFNGITIPASVTKIRRSVFKGCNSIVIEYQGTTSQWEQIDKDPRWNIDNAIAQIFCKDGFVVV